MYLEHFPQLENFIVIELGGGALVGNMRLVVKQFDNFGKVMSLTLVIDDYSMLPSELKLYSNRVDSLVFLSDGNGQNRDIALAIKVESNPVLFRLNMFEVINIESLCRLKAYGLPGKMVLLIAASQNCDALNENKFRIINCPLKDIEPEKILEILIKATSKKIVINGAISTVLTEELQKTMLYRERDICLLTSREREIIRLIANGLSNKVIAKELQISEGTVKVHVQHIFKKLNLKSRLETAVWAIKQEF